ncbi:MAG: TonB-dependent receptor [Myxococcota bacterium]
MDTPPRAPSRASRPARSADGRSAPPRRCRSRHGCRGAEYRFKSLEWDAIRQDETENHFAAYFQDNWRFGKRFAAVVSARLDLHPLIGPLGSPRLAFIFNPGERQAIRLSVGTAFRVPTMAETYLSLAANVPSSPGTAVTLVGREELDPEGIATIDLGYRLESDVGNFELVGWFNRVTNLIVRTPLESTGADARFIPRLNAVEVARSFYVNEARVFLGVGGEVAGRIYPVDGLDLGGSYAFQYIFDESTGERFTDSPLHKASLWGQLRTSIGLDLGVSVNYVSDQDWVEPDFDPTSPTGFDTEPFPLDANVTMLARVGYRLLEDRLELAVSGFNLLDVGDARHREHPFANRLEARVLGSVTGRF